MKWLVYIFARSFVGGLRWLPRRMAYALCRGVADLFYFFDRKHRRIGLVNLEIAFPESTPGWRRNTLRSSFRRLGELAVEIAHLGSISREEIVRRVRYEDDRGLKNYEKAKAAAGDRGILFVTAHFSAWELLPTAHAVLGHPLSFIVRPLDNPYLEQWVSSIRSRFGNRTLSKRLAMRGVLGELEKGRDVGFLIDQNVQQKEGIFVPFLGHPAATTTSVATLASRKGLPMVAGFLYPEGPAGHYRIRFYPPLWASGEDSENVIRDTTARLNSLIEDMIREHPDCWLWGHRRFSTQPEGVNPYETRGGRPQPPQQG